MRLFAPFLAVATAACGSFGETASGAGPDASAPAPAPDGGTSSARPPTSCAGTQVFDDDFARTTPAGNGWALLTGAPRIEPGIGAPAPSLLAFADVQADGQKAEHAIGRTSPIAQDGQICIELDAMIQADPVTFTGASYAELLAIKPNAGANVFVEMRSAGLSLVVGSDAPVPVQGFAFGKWRHLVLRLRFGGGNAELEVDGVIARRPTAVAETPTSVDIEVGIDAAGSGGQAGATRFLVDNVRATSPGS